MRVHKDTLGWMVAGLALVSASVVGGSGCILENNPDFVEASATGDSTSAGSGATDSEATMGTGPGPTGTGVDTTAGPTDPSDSTSTGGGLPGGTGCDDPTLCTTLHIGPAEGTCERDVGGDIVDECDEVGFYALRIALGRLAFEGNGGLIIIHDNNGAVARYAGSAEVLGQTTIRGADGQDPRTVVVQSHQSTENLAGTLRLVEDGIHLQGFTLAVKSGGEWAVRVRADEEVEGTETGEHLIENMALIAARPENVGSNSIAAVFQSLGPDTIVRNNHIWGFFEGTLDMRFAHNSVFSHNTLLYYQRSVSPLIDATLVGDLEISNNVIISLTEPIATFVFGDSATSRIVVVGNALEGVTSLLSGIEETSIEVKLEDNTLGLLELESPREPRVLADSSLSASDLASSTGTSFDGVDLSAGAELPGAFQVRSTLSTPRRSVITVGEVSCGGQPCTLDQVFDNEVQRAVWSAWPGSSVELYPSTDPYAGPVVVSWAIELRGMGQEPQQVVIDHDIEDDLLSALGVWEGKDAIIDLTGGMDRPSVVENLSVEAPANFIGIAHEGSGALDGRHEIRRVILGDDGEVSGQPARYALYIGESVVVHDTLVHGGFESCVRFGPRSSESRPTDPVTAWVHHLTCRLTEPSPDSTPVAGFEVAAVVDAVIADIAVELPEPGPLFRAQRRSNEDSEEPVALDVPVSFWAHSISARGYEVLFDGFSDVDGGYVVVEVDPVGELSPLFVSPVDSHLIGGSLAIDGGIDPAMLEQDLMLGVSLDGIDRVGLAPDRGAYEQGL